MAKRQVKFSGSITGQTNRMLIKALTDDDPIIMAAIHDFFGISKKAHDGGQTVGSRVVLLMERGLRAYLEDNQHQSLGIQQVLTTQSIPTDYSSNVTEEVIESDMDNFKFIEDEL